MDQLILLLNLTRLRVLPDMDVSKGGRLHKVAVLDEDDYICGLLFELSEVLELGDQGCSSGYLVEGHLVLVPGDEYIVLEVGLESPHPAEHHVYWEADLVLISMLFFVNPLLVFASYLRLLLRVESGAHGRILQSHVDVSAKRVYCCRHLGLILTFVHEIEDENSIDASND